MFNPVNIFNPRKEYKDWEGDLEIDRLIRTRDETDMKPTPVARRRDHPVSEQQMKYKWKIQIYVETERSMSLQDVFYSKLTTWNNKLAV